MLFFNYRSEWNKLWDEQILRDRYSYATRFPQVDQPGLRVSLLTSAETVPLRR
jgi:hypothetical protein